ncbi:MAG: GntR family transcriptional regulator [Desulfobacteraceae bacterium]|nr:GntR family transcriptional regulator [Desulfobacteraceae bacterium]
MAVKQAEIVHMSYSEQIAGVIEEDILNGVYKPGQRITETELSSRFKVSRSPLREALQKLEYQGFLEKEPYKGYRVIQPTYKDVIDTFIVRANLESLAVHIAVEEQDPEVLEQLVTLHEQMKEAATNRDRELYYKLNWQFHKVFHDGCKNKRLQSLLDNFSKQTERFRKEYFKTQGQMERSLTSHATLISLFKENKAEAAGEYRKETLLLNAKRLADKIST